MHMMALSVVPQCMSGKTPRRPEVDVPRTLCRDEYTIDQLVGGHSGKFFIAGRACIREDTVLVCWPCAASSEVPLLSWGLLLLCPTGLPLLT